MSVERLLQLDKIRLNQIAAEQTFLPRLKEDVEQLTQHALERKARATSLKQLQEKLREARETLKPLCRKRKKRTHATVVTGAESTGADTSTTVVKRGRRRIQEFTLAELTNEVDNSVGLVPECEPGEQAKSLYAKLDHLNQTVSACISVAESEIGSLEHTINGLTQRAQDIEELRLQNEYFATSTRYVAAASELQRSLQQNIDRLQAALRFGSVTPEQRAQLMQEYETMRKAFTAQGDELLRQYTKDTQIDPQDPSSALAPRNSRLFRDKHGTHYARCLDGACVNLSTPLVTVTPELTKLAKAALLAAEQKAVQDIANTGGFRVDRGVKRKKKYRKSIQAAVVEKFRKTTSHIGGGSAASLLSDIDSYLQDKGADGGSGDVSGPSRRGETSGLTNEELASVYSLEQRTKNPYVYKKENHMRDLLNIVQGRCHSVLPTEVMDEVKLELRKYGPSFRYETLTPLRIKKILGELGRADFYDHIFYIANALNPKFELCNFEKVHEDRVLQRFCATEKPFESVKTAVVHERRNFMSYPFVAFKICELEEFLCEHALEKRQKEMETFLAHPNPSETFTVESAFAQCQDAYELMIRGFPNEDTQLAFSERWDDSLKTTLHVIQIKDYIRWLKFRVTFLEQEMAAWGNYRIHFKFLKDGKLMKKQDRWWRLCCEELNWPPIKTVGNEGFSFVPIAKPWSYNTRPMSPKSMARYHSQFSFLTQSSAAVTANGNQDSGVADMVVDESGGGGSEGSDGEGDRMDDMAHDEPQD